MTTKYCSKCKKTLETKNFYKNRSTKDGLGSWCIKCLLPLHLKQRNEIKAKVRARGFKGKCEIGRKYELIALNILPGSIDVSGKSFKSPYDILWNGKKIDVKMRNFNKNNKWQFWSRNTTNSDYYLLFCCVSGNVEKIIMLPQKYFINGLAIGKLSKYDRYKLNCP